MKTLGILGGMGPEATADLFRKIIELTPAKKDQDHIRIIIDNYPQIPDRTANILGDGESPVPYMIKSATLLEKAGAQAIIMPCNTAHYFLPVIKSSINVPFISIIDSAVAEIKRITPNAKTVLPISTTGTKSTKLYENALAVAGYTVPEIPANIQEEIMHCIYEGVKKGKTTEVKDRFQKVLDDIKKDVKPDAMIAACTEIPILMPYVHTDISVADATLALAKAGVAFAMEQ